jgi:phosphatidylinositol phospholipase C delta
MNSIEIDHKEGEPDGIVIDEHLSRARFEVYLYHGLNDAYDPECLNRHIALDQPMSQYYINTSHNTYLTGDQLQSSSSVEMYTRALQRGCKCIELDCWDGDKSKKSGLTLFHPVVFHGHTLTSKILFEDVLQAVKCYIDDNPDTYPIILSLESHCSHDFQRAMAKYLEETFGDDLYVPKGTPSGDLPSPESLRGKVVIKGKRPPDPDDSANVELLSENNDDDYDQYEATGSVEPSPQNKPKNKGDLKTTPAKPPKIVPELARLTLFHGTKLKTFEQSISEPQASTFAL